MIGHLENLCGRCLVSQRMSSCNENARGNLCLWSLRKAMQDKGRILALSICSGGMPWFPDESFHRFAGETCAMTVLVRDVKASYRHTFRIDMRFSATGSICVPRYRDYSRMKGHPRMG